MSFYVFIGKYVYICVTNFLCIVFLFTIVFLFLLQSTIFVVVLFEMQEDTGACYEFLNFLKEMLCLSFLRNFWSR